MKRTAWLVVFALAVPVAMLTTGCDRLWEDSTDSSAGKGSGGADAGFSPPGTEVALIAAKNINIGTVTVTNDGGFAYVTYATTGGWEMAKTHLAVTDAFDKLPQNKSGNPTPGRFPYKAVHDPPVATYCYTIPLEGLKGNELYVAAHAEVQILESFGGIREETAWAEGEQFPGANWAMYFTHALGLDVPEREEAGIDAE